MSENCFIDLIKRCQRDEKLDADQLLSGLEEKYMDDIISIEPLDVIKRVTGNNMGYYLKKLLYKDAWNSIYLLEWEPQQATPLHNHYFKGHDTFCYFYVLYGEFVEMVLENGDYKCNTYEEGMRARINKAEYMHILKNNSNAKSYTIHIYPE